MSNKKFFLIIVFIVVVVIILESFNFFDVYEKVYPIDSTILNSGEDTSGYDILVTDDVITFYDDDGNSIIYTFEADRLVNVSYVYNAKSEFETKYILEHYTDRIGNGEISDVTCSGKNVFVEMDMKFFSEYEGYSKKEIEDILLKNAEKKEKEN